MMRLERPLVGLVSRAPARMQTKLLAAFLVIVVLLIALGAVDLQVLSAVNRHTDRHVEDTLSIDIGGVNGHLVAGLGLRTRERVDRTHRAPVAPGRSVGRDHVEEFHPADCFLGHLGGRATGALLGDPSRQAGASTSRSVARPAESERGALSR